MQIRKTISIHPNLWERIKIASKPIYGERGVSSYIAMAVIEKLGREDDKPFIITRKDVQC